MTENSNPSKYTLDWALMCGVVIDILGKLPTQWSNVFASQC